MSSLTLDLYPKAKFYMRNCALLEREFLDTYHNFFLNNFNGSCYLLWRPKITTFGFTRVRALVKGILKLIITCVGSQYWDQPGLLNFNFIPHSGEFQHGVRLGQGVYINYQTGFVQRGFWAKGGFVESTVQLHPTRRQSAIYPAIYPIPMLLETCDNTVDKATSTGCKGVGNVFQRPPQIMIRCGKLLKCVKW